MAREIRKKSVDLFVVTLREAQESIKQLSTDQDEKWNTRLRTVLGKFKDIIAEPTIGLPPSREFDFGIHLGSGEPPKERTYRMSTAEL